MKKTNNKNIVYLVIAGIVLLGGNAWVWTAVQSGQLSPVSSPVLWISFMVLNVASLLWACSLLGLQPLVVACSYAAGGFLAYRGVQGTINISVAEVTTAGATYGAIGALAVGNIGTKVRMAFSRRGHTPFIVVIVGLLVVDGVLNSQISGAGWDVILNALIFPFVLAGVVVGLIWMVFTRFGLSHKPRIADRVMAEVPVQSQMQEDEDSPDASQLMIKIPDASEEEIEPVERVAITKEAPRPKETPSMDEPAAEPVAMVAEVVPEETVEDEPHFFPLEIDKDDDFILPAEEAVTGDLFVVKEDSYESAFDLAQEMEPTLDEPMQQTVHEVEPEPEPVTDRPEPESQKAETSDWLSGHLNLLNKISSNETEK